MFAFKPETLTTVKKIASYSAPAFYIIMQNLIINSFNHGLKRTTDSGKEITSPIDAGELAGFITIKIEIKDSDLIMSYSDNGEGYPAEEFNIIQSGKIAPPQGGDTLYGIFILQESCKFMNWNVEFKSKENSSEIEKIKAVIKFTIPLDD
jgi:sensor histidine kinase regulating citrate/malate metabolism